MDAERDGPAEPTDLLRLALARPAEALAQARSLVGSTTDPLTLSIARQAIGIVIRDRGDLDPAVTELRAALRLARSTGSRERVSDVRATLGASLVLAGRTKAGLDQLDKAATNVHGAMLAKILMRRAYVLALAGRHAAALDDMRRALAGFRRAGDTVWEARALNNRALIEIAVGAIGRAEDDVLRAERLYLEAGQDLEAAFSRHNRGLIGYYKGDLPTALSLYDEVAERYAQFGVAAPELAIDRCTALLAAGLPDEAVRVVRHALDSGQLPTSGRAELMLMLASAALSDGDQATALSSARAARRLFRTQERAWWEARADLVIARARYQAGSRTARLLESTSALGERLQLLRAEDAPIALLLAGRMAADLHDASRSQHLRAAARYRHTGSGLARATGWLAQALECDASDSPRGVFSACSRGLDVLDEHQMTLGSTELRALATRHGEAMAGLALRQAATRHRPRSLLQWTERWRATALTQPPVRPPNELDLVAELAAMRDCVRRLDEARATGSLTAGLEQERSRLERTIRSRRLRVSGDKAQRVRFDVERLVTEVGDGCLVEIVEIDKVLHVLVVGRGRVRHYLAGGADEAHRAVEFARLALRQVGRGRAADLTGVGARLQEALLGPAGAALPEGPVVIAPPSRFHATPWAILPVLADRAITAVPSAALWLRITALREPVREPTVLIVGPGLSTGGAEVIALARQQPAARVLRGGAATVESSLAALDGSTLAHVAAHGRFRRDSPMFSCLVLDDGPLTVHDFELLHQAPYRMILSACDSGVMAPVGADELLGLVSAMFSLGSAGLVTSVTEVNDAATVGLMLELHHGIQAGQGLGEVLLAARLAARDDVVRHATAVAFAAFGI